MNIKRKNIWAGFKYFLLIAALILTGTAWAQDGRTLQGRVVDAEGKPIVGAIVNVVEESRIVITDNDGNFTLKNVVSTDDIYAACIGYKAETIPADFDADFKIVLLEDTDPYAAMAPLPFTQLPKKFVTASTSVVTGEELEKHPITVLQNAFTSTVTGVQTYEAQSEPGWSETYMYIRGPRTMNYSLNARSPLVIVDNVERDLSFLDAYPIESITIVKDAAATAIYGMRGANGAILVTTKRGQAGKTKISFTQEFGYQASAGIPESQNSYNYALTRNQAAYLDGRSPEFSATDLEYYRRVSNGETLEGMAKYKYFNTNWHDVMLRDLAPQMRTNFSVSGGNDRARYFVSFSYLRQEGLFDSKWTEWNDEGYSTQMKLNRFNLRSNVDIDVNRFLNVSLDLGGRIDNITQPGIDMWNIFTWGAGENLPVYPVFTPNGDFFMPTSSDSKNGAAQIAGRGITQNRRRNLYSTITATGNLGDLVPGLKAKMTFSFDSYETFQKTQVADVNVYYYNYMDNVNDVSEYSYQRMRTYMALPNATTLPRDYYYNINMNGGLEYSRTFGKHAVNAQTFIRSYQNVVRGQNSSNRYLSFNGMASYIYDNKYILSGNISHMGSDNFAEGERYGTFPGISAGWVMSEESWLKDSPVKLLKLRASYGRAGQAVIGGSRYPYQSSFAEGSGYNFGTSQSAVSGAYESTAGNSNIKWELSDMLNIGADFDLWNKRIYGSVDAFKEWRSNILVNRSTIPTMFGIAAPRDSYGKVETKGAEITLGHQNKVGNFEYFIDGMLTYNTNKITEMDELPPDYAYQARTGQRIDQSFLLRFSQWASDESMIPESHQDAIDNPWKYPYSAAGKYKLGNAVFQDTNGDRIINDYDKVATGYAATALDAAVDRYGIAVPELIPSIRLGVSWKGIDARVILTAYLNRSVPTRENMDYGFGWGGTSTHAVTDTWGYYTDDPTDPRNINAKYPRLSTSFSDVDRNYPYNESDIWVVNGDFLSLRNVEVGYSLPLSLISKLSMTKCRVYFSGYNLHTWSHLPKGFDPENPTNYIWAYPKTKSFSVGVNIEF